MQATAIGTRAASSCCEARRLAELDGTVVCTNCGCVHENRCFDSSGYVMVGDEQYQSRHAKQHVAVSDRPDTIHGCGSFIDFYSAGYFRDARDVPLLPHKQELYYRLKFTRDFRTRVDHDETRVRVLRVLGEVVNRLSLVPSIKARAAYMYDKIVKHARSKVINHVTLIASCIFLAVKEKHAIAPVVIKEICDAFVEFHHRVTPGLVLRDIAACKEFSTFVAKRHDPTVYVTRQLSLLSNDERFISRYGRKTRVPVTTYLPWLEGTVTAILAALPKAITANRNPYNLTAAAIYFADRWYAKQRFGMKRVLTQEIVGNATNVAEYAVREAYTSIARLGRLSINRPRHDIYHA